MARAPGPPGRRRWLIIAGVVIALFLVLFTALSGFYIDLLWFREVHFSSIFWTILRTKFLLGLIFGVAFFAMLYANLLIVRWITPRYRALTPDQEIVERYRVAFEPYIWWALPAFSVVIAFFVGIGVTGQWQHFLLWRNAGGVSFGAVDPVFKRDPAFYVFSLPWLKFVQGWLFSALVGVTIISAIAHYLWGGIRPQSATEKVTPQVKAHFSVLLGVIVLTKAWGYQLGKFDLLTSPRGVVTGASYTDIHAQLPALKLLVFFAIVCAVLFLVNIRFRGWALPVIAVGLLGLASIVLGGLYPGFVQRFRVAPQEQQRERPFIQRNITATRQAFGLDSISMQPRPVDAVVTPQSVADNSATISNTRLWRPDVLGENYKSLQRIKQYYEFTDVDVDRYELNGELRVLMIAAREVSQDGIPTGGQTWQNRHLIYTHGIGAVGSQVNTATTEGGPVFTVSDIPPVGEPQMIGNGQRVYYSEVSDVPFIVVNTGARELDFESSAGAQQRTFQYNGTGGIPIGGFFQRALFAWKYRDVNLLISGLIHPDSRILIYRDIQTRVQKAAPFLQFDGDPYAAVIDGRLVWIWDAYTTANQYPYSQELDLGSATSTSPATPGLSGTANYIRNSVKVEVDAYNGTMKFYVADPTDPIIQVWQQAFPDLFTTIDQAPDSLKAHFRYPENLFQVQATQFANYHVTNPDVFYQKQDLWQIPVDPTTTSEGTTAQPSTTTIGSALRPYYLLMRLPGETQAEFVLILPFVPQGRQNMVAWMAAKSDPADYGQVVAYEFPQGENVDGPTQVFSRMQQDPRFSSDQTLFGQSGSRVLFGDFLVIPLGNAFLYVEPVYVRSAQENAIPELKRVLVVNGDKVGLGDNFASALADALGGVAPPPTGGGGQPPPSGNVNQQIAALVQQALQHFAKADEALKAGDLATYQREINLAEQAIQKANQLAAKTSSSPTPSPTPSATPSPTSTATPTA